jgi:PAS domain S-box-containing protein
MVAIILISSLAFLLFQARKDVLASLALHEAQLAIQFALVEARPDVAGTPTILDSGAGHSFANSPGIAEWPGQTTIAMPLASACANDAVCRNLPATLGEDTKGKFVIRNGKLFAAMHDGKVVILSSAPLSALTAGMLSRIALDIAAVFFLGCLLLLVRESRLSDYSVHRLLDASPIPLALIDADGRLEFANRTALDLLADDRSRSLEGLQESLRRHEHLFSWLVGGQDATGQIQSGEFEIEHHSGTVRHLLVSRQSLLVRSRRMIIASIADITVRHEAETALIKAKNAAEALERMKSESLAMISHELRTPVNGVLGLAQLLVRYELPDAAASIVRRLIQAGKTLAVIINDVVDLALLEVRQIRLDRRPFDPQEVITGAASLASAAAAEKGLRVRVSTVTPLPAAVFGDAARVQQIIVNLVGNSIKFTQVGQIEVTTDIAARHERSIEIAIEVTDTGIGIAPDVLPRLFQPFSQAETGHERRFEGTGLGLAISKGLAETMGGTISVRSEVGRGSTFLVRLPFELAEIEEIRPAGLSMSRVLVVDDVALNRDIVTELIRAEGCEATAASSGQEALEVLKTGTFDLILMDIRMPGMDGLTATAAIRASREPNRHTGPIIGLTANPLPTDRPLYRLRGIDGIIEKPVEVEKLRIALKETQTTPSASTPILTAEPERIGRLRESLGQDRTSRIVRSFMQVANESVEAIANGCARANLEDVAENAHRLSGAASNVGFAQLADTAAELERLARTGNVFSVSEVALNTITIYRDAERCVHTYFPSLMAGPENKYPVP